jgi:hypothetical protein
LVGFRRLSRGKRGGLLFGTAASIVGHLSPLRLSLSTSRSLLGTLYLFFFPVSLVLLICQAKEAHLLVKEQVVRLLFRGLRYCRHFVSFLLFEFVFESGKLTFCPDRSVSHIEANRAIFNELLILYSLLLIELEVTLAAHQGAVGTHRRTSLSRLNSGHYNSCDRVPLFSFEQATSVENDLLISRVRCIRGAVIEDRRCACITMLILDVEVQVIPLTILLWTQEALELHLDWTITSGTAGLQMPLKCIRPGEVLGA